MSFWKSTPGARWAAGEAELHPACVQAFEHALRDGGFGPGVYPAWNAYVNRDVLAIYGDEGWLGFDDVARLYAERASRQREQYPQAYWRKAGNLFHYAVQLGLIAGERGGEHGRGWRLVHREPQWVVDSQGGRSIARQVLGLPPAEQAAEYRRQARQAKLTATLDRKARHAADAEIAALVSAILAGDPDATVPEHWAASNQYRLPCVPEWLPGTRIDVCAPVLREAHHTLDVPRQTVREWLRELRHAARIAPTRYARRQAEKAALPEHADIPAEDAEALGGLL